MNRKSGGGLGDPQRKKQQQGLDPREAAHRRVTAQRRGWKAARAPDSVDWKWGLRVRRASGLEEGWCISPRARGHSGTTGTSNRGQMETMPSARWALSHHGGHCREKGRHPTRCLSPRPSDGGRWQLGSPLGNRRKGRGNLQLTVFTS